MVETTLIKPAEMRLYDDQGQRLYLNAEERQAFLTAARERSARDRTLCETLHFTGCRPEELTQITPRRIDFSGAVTIRTLKKRKDDLGRPRIVFRSVPVPAEYIDTLEIAFGIRERQRSRKKADEPLWPLTRQRVWQISKAVMDEAGIIDGPNKTAKGLRHGFGVNATVNGVPLNMLKKWMGHESIETTAIYADAIGKEERDIAARMWG